MFENTATILISGFITAVVIRVSIRGYFTEKYSYLRRMITESNLQDQDNSESDVRVMRHYQEDEF